MSEDIHQHSHGLGRRTPTDARHIERYPLRAVIRAEAAPAVVKVRHHLTEATREFYDQNGYGACVGFSLSKERSFANRKKMRGARTPLYHSFPLWDRAKATDEWSDTNPGDNEGTSIRAGLEILRTEGHWRRVGNRFLPHPDPIEGIAAYRWAHNLGEVRAALAAGLIVVFGINWYSLFDTPIKRKYKYGRTEAFMALGNWRPEELGPLMGGHAICATAWDDEEQLIGFDNTWGFSWGDNGFAWAPTSLADWLLIRQWGEAAVITDK